MKNHQVKKLFIFFLIFLPLQYAMVGIIGVKLSEPWPAFVFPGFKNVYVYEDGYALSSAVFEIHQEGTAGLISLAPHEFLPEIPMSQISGFMLTQFSSEEITGSFNAETKNWLMNQAANFTDGSVSDVHVVWRQNFYSKSGSKTMQDSTVEMSRFSLITGDIADE